MSARRIAWGFVANLYDKLLIAGVQLVMVPVLVLHWGLHLYGCWVVLATVPGFLALADLGFGGAAFVRMTSLVARGERDGAVVVWQTACQMIAIASAATLALALLVIWSVPAGWLPQDPRLSDGDARFVLVLLALYALVVFQGSLQAAGYASAQLFPLLVTVNAHVILAENVLLGIAAVSGHGPLAGAAALLVGRAGGVTLAALLLRRRASWLRLGIDRADAGERRVLARSAVSMLAIPLAQATALQGGVIALGAAAGPAATPAFAAARTLSRIGLQATQLLTHALLPEFTAADGRGDRRGQAMMLCAVVAASILTALPFAFLLGFAGDWLMGVWTKGAVTPTPGLMPVMALSVMLSGLWSPLSSLMYAIDRQGAFAWAYLATGLISLLVTFALGRILGATGAAVAFTALDAVMLVVVGRFAVTHWLRGLPVGEVARALLTRGRQALR